MTEERTLATYEVVRTFWRTTEAFDTVRGKMPPDGIFLKDGDAYFVSQSIAVKAPIPITRIELFVRPDFGTKDDGWMQDEDLHAKTERKHPYADLGPRPHHFKRLFPNVGATFPEVRALFRPATEGFRLDIDHDAIRDYIARTAGPRGNGNSGYLAVSFGEDVSLRFIYTPKQGEPSAADGVVKAKAGAGASGTVGLSPYSVLYALRFLGDSVIVSIGDGKLWVVDETTGKTVVLATRPVSEWTDATSI